jgi:hypothetical protein
MPINAARGCRGEKREPAQQLAACVPAYTHYYYSISAKHNRALELIFRGANVGDAMVNWFSPRCPLNTWEKTWTEVRMRWLADQFGIDRLLQAEVILPNEQYFPDPYNETPEDVQRLLDRLCGYMGADPLRLSLEILDDRQLPHAAGQYDRSAKPVIRVARSQLLNPEALLATLAHEVSHDLLFTHTKLTAGDRDFEWVTDLLPVFLGVGMFAANTTVSEEYHHLGQVSWWRIGKQGYLPSRIFGYAFALFTFMRRESGVEWARQLRLDASSALRDGLRYLQKTNDTLFHPDSIRQKPLRPSPGAMAERLRAGSPSARMAALWEVREEPVVADAQVVAAVVECLAENDESIPGEAARTLAAIGPAAAVAVPSLIKSLQSANPHTRGSAAFALGSLGQQCDGVVAELSELFIDENRNVRASVAKAVAQFGTSAASAIPRLLAALSSALVECDYALIDLFTEALRAIAENPEKEVLGYFTDTDGELRDLAVSALRGEHLQSEEQAAIEPEHGAKPS